MIGGYVGRDMYWPLMWVGACTWGAGGGGGLACAPRRSRREHVLAFDVCKVPVCTQVEATIKPEALANDADPAKTCNEPQPSHARSVVSYLRQQPGVCFS